MSRQSARVLIATLHIDCGQTNRRGEDVRQPTATYACHLCGYAETVRGRDQVRAFTPHIRTTHRQACPAAGHHTERTAA
ncbi:hypothetical protein V2S66_31585 [Streptomyces sp. V4-01]|uniref:Transposase n=1 Tax=Actinacidiphila polyblastidii TaxID=3110430 RepID=A0ABU7PKY5_9ACTN|nr:hypothetical protein [Streptomyces sp. V4-01]